jgi:hypothetical protein
MDVIASWQKSPNASREPKQLHTQRYKGKKAKRPQITAAPGKPP